MADKGNTWEREVDREGVEKEIKFRVLVHILVIFTFSAAILLEVSCSKHNEEPAPQKILKIKAIHDISMFGDYRVSKPLKMLCFDNKIYILDKKFLQVFVFTGDGYSHSIGQPGQGPGEISYPVSFDIANDRLYLLNSPDRIEVFDLWGKDSHTIKLKREKLLLPALWDCGIYDRTIYVSLHIGNIKVQRYNLDGDYIDDFITDDSRIDPRKAILSRPYNIHILPGRNELILFNQFDGDIEIYDLLEGNQLRKIHGYDTIIAERVSLIRKSLKKTYSEKNELNVKVFIMLRSFLDKDDRELLIIPSQISLKKEEKWDLIYIYDLNRNIIEQGVIRFIDFEAKHLRHCCKVNCNLFFLDEELNLYKGGIE